jgi:hypothetical protein
MVTDPEARFPRAGGASLADVVPSLLSALDVPGFANPLGVEPARRACLLVIDGLGFEQLEANREQVPFLTAGATSVQPISAGFPATTVASLGSDVMYLERLHWEAAVDVVPEELAERAGDRFRR